MLIDKLRKNIFHFLAYKKNVPFFYRDFLFKILTIGSRVEKKCLTGDFEKLTSRGFVYLPQKKLNAVDILELKNHLKHCQHKDILKGDKLVRRNYERRDLAQSAKILQIALDEDVVNLCSAYFGAQARVAYITAWTTYTNDENDSAELSFHMDHHGHIFLKYFIYLDDVEIGDGEHQYVVGTTDYKMPDVLKRLQGASKNLYRELTFKRKKAGAHKLNNTEVSSYFGNDVVHQVGPAGTCFLEDTYGLHRGSAIKNNRPRTILQTLYCPLVMEKDISKHINIKKPDNMENSHFTSCMSASFKVVK